MIHWLAAEDRNKVWRGLGAEGNTTEMPLFPGLLAPLLALAAFLLPPFGSKESKRPRESSEPVPEQPPGYQRILVTLLDATALISGIVALLTFGYDVFKLRLFGHVVLSATGPTGPLNILIITVFVRCLIEQCNRHNLFCELIIVEWNPPFLRPPLKEALELAATENARARATDDCKKGIASFLQKQDLKW